MLTRLYTRLIALAATPRAPLWLAGVSFAEASVFPLPPDVLLIPMVLARPRRAFAFGGLCTLASVLGGLFGYWIGDALLTPLAWPVIKFYHAEGAYRSFVDFFVQYGFWAILFKGLTPIPFKLVTIAAGAAHFNLGKFVLACIITRGGRFVLLEALPLRYFGDQARDFIERRLGMVTAALAATLVGGVLALRFL